MSQAEENPEFIFDQSTPDDSVVATLDLVSTDTVLGPEGGLAEITEGRVRVNRPSIHRLDDDTSNPAPTGHCVYCVAQPFDLPPLEGKRHYRLAKLDIELKTTGVSARKLFSYEPPPSKEHRESTYELQTGLPGIKPKVSERIKRVVIRRDYVVRCYGENSSKFAFEYLQKDGNGIEPGSKYAFAQIIAPEDFEVVVAVLKISVIVVRPSLVPHFNKSEPATKNYELVWDLRGTPSVSSCPAE